MSTGEQKGGSDEATPVFSSPRRGRSSTVTSIAQSVQLATNIVNDVLNKDPPPGFFAAAAGTASSAPTVGDIRRGSLGSKGFNTVRPTRNIQRQGSSTDTRHDSQRSQSWRKSQLESETSRREQLKRDPVPVLDHVHEEHPLPKESVEPFPDFDADETQPEAENAKSRTHQIEPAETEGLTAAMTLTVQGGKVSALDNGDTPVNTWTTTIAIGLRAFFKWMFTPFGFFWTLYGLNVVAWGGMLFLLLVNAAPAMCWAPTPDSAPSGQPPPVASLQMIRNAPRRFDCDDIFSPRRIWLEIDSQILNALFCVTGFGLAPWRFRDLWYLLAYRLTSRKRQGMVKKMNGLRMLAGIYRDWFRLPGSDTLDIWTTACTDDTISQRKSKATSNFSPPTPSETVDTDAIELRTPLPITKTLTTPETGVRAPPTAIWKMDLFVWCQIGNTAFQAVLCVFMWGMNRYNRPSWATGLFIALAFSIAGVGGIVAFIEGRRVKRIEGVRREGDLESRPS